MKKYLLGFFLAGSMLGLSACGSGTSGTTGSSGTPTSCNSDADCGTGICNKLGHVCMTKCTMGSDCPDTAKNCDVIKDASGAAQTSDKVCQCSTDQLCGGGSTFCHPVDKLCEVKCSDNSGCSGFNPARTCTTSTGACNAGAVDAGSPDAGGMCETTGCPTGQTCDTTTHMCKAGGCSPDNAQGGCAAGQYCQGGACTAPTCSSLSSQPSNNANSPVIWSVAYDSQRDDTSGTCGGDGKVNHFTGHYYDPDGNDDIPTGTALYNNIFILKASGTIPSSGNSQEKTSVDPSSGTFTFELCSDRTDAVAVVIADKEGNKSNSACISQ